jgi:hypothetical protein
MRRVTVHIGLPKTATTTLQQKVFANHTGMHYLGPRANYPEFDEVMRDLCYADSLNYDVGPSMDVVQKLVMAPHQANKPVVVSHEAVSAQGRDRRLKAERLKALFPDGGIVFTVRRPEDMVVSIYFQWLKGFGGKRREAPCLDAWLEQDHQDAWKSNFLRLQYEKVLELYRSLFGRENVLLLFFEDLIADRAKFARALSEFIGVDSAATSVLLTQESNPRMSPLRYSEVRLYANFPLIKSLHGVKGYVPDELKNLVKKRMGGKVTQDLSPEWRRRIRDYAKSENPTLKREFSEIAKYDYF